MTGRPHPAAFSLIELLVVVAIIGISMGLVAFLPSSDKRNADVKAAAEELAATLRLARSMAIERRVMMGVAFNIQNGAGTSGRVINNRDGGHWYRIIGPTDTHRWVMSQKTEGWPMYPQSTLDFGLGDSVPSFLGEVKDSWVGDRHVLPARKVRFLALSDQDDGGIIDHAAGSWWPEWRAYGATYPRPWFGHWDPASGRLYPWGGYDPTLVDSRGRPSSGFWFQGRDGPITGCLNPSDRMSTTADTNVLVFKQGEVRPLINGDWLDYVIRFNPDGSVCEGQVMRARKMSWMGKGSGTGAGLPPGDLGDLMNDFPYGYVANINDYATQGYGLEATPTPHDLSPIKSYEAYTGFWSLTLAPDMDRDSDSFGSAQEAVNSLMPAYRVMINRFGVVKVVKVRPTPPAGLVLDTTTISNWQSPAQTSVYYQHQVATNPDGTRRGMPVSDFITPHVLAARQWWMP